MKKNPKSKSTQSNPAADQDIVGLITTLVQKLISLETKIDTILSQTSARTSETPRQQPISAPTTAARVDPRPMYKAICADCSKECEVPFRPSVDRPVYCKVCFAARKNKVTFVPRQESKLKEVSPTRPVIAEKPPAAKPAAHTGKKKLAAKKTKKK